MTSAEFESLCQNALCEFRRLVPYDTGNMANNATKLVQIDAFTWKLYIDINLAPYARYTNIPWRQTSPIILNAPNNKKLLGKSSFLWNHGDKPEASPKRNPNENWFSKAAKNLAEIIAASNGGTLKK